MRRLVLLFSALALIMAIQQLMIYSQRASLKSSDEALALYAAQAQGLTTQIRTAMALAEKLKGDMNTAIEIAEAAIAKADEKWKEADACKTILRRNINGFLRQGAAWQRN